jgi:tetratricopeptide (TPR) repeat protein/cytochrome b561
MPPAADRAPVGRALPPVVGPRLSRLLKVAFLLFGLLAVNSLYLASVTLVEELSGDLYQDFLYQVMFLLHLVLGFLIILPAVIFGALHLRNAWPRPNYRAVRAGLALYLTVLLLLISGLALTRFDFFSLKDPVIRNAAYWLHVATPLLAIWLFILHRLAGKGIRYRRGIAWGAAAVLLTAVALAPRVLEHRGPEPEAAAIADDRSSPFFPALSGTPGDGYLPADLLMMDGYCEECHADVHEKWQYSAHRLSSFNNPAYRFSVMRTREMALERDGNTHASRFCAGCHDPVPLFSGAFDDPLFGEADDPLANAGITCTACHAITRIDSPRGNADYTIEAPEHYPFTFSRSPFLQWVNQQLVKAKPAFHKKTFLKPLHREPEFCGSCHKVHLPPELNDYKWLRGQNHQDAYHLSGVSGHGASSFYYPPKAVHTCAGCHMPLEASDDFGAAYFDDSGILTVHNHQFPAANTALPHMTGAPPWVNEAHRAFLEGALRVDLFALKAGGRIDDPLTAPLRPDIPTLEPGRSYLLETVVRTLKLGHLFTQGTADSNEVWLEVTVRSGDRVIGRSGHREADGTVDPWSHFVNVYMLDRDGNRIDRRNAEDIFTPLYDHQIPPGAADVVHYRFEVPPDSLDPVSVEVRLNYRKFDTTYLRHIRGDDFEYNDLPITLIAQDRIVFPVATGAAPAVSAAVDVPGWERWNDYGIGLLRKDQKGQMRQAEEAFSRVEELGRPDGPMNLARVYLREGRVDDAAEALRRAAAFDPPAYPWLLTWFTGLVNKQNGQLDEAIANFRYLLNTDFDEARRREFDFGQDFRVINELAQTLFERAKAERGPERREARDRLLDESRSWFEKTLSLDPENTAAHYNLALIHTLLGNEAEAREHRTLHERYRPDDNAAERAVRLHRSRNPAADHAAEAVVIYDLQRAFPTERARTAGAGGG